MIGVGDDTSLTLFRLLEWMYQEKRVKEKARKCELWCRRWDLNPHNLAITGTWSQRVCHSATPAKYKYLKFLHASNLARWALFTLIHNSTGYVINITPPEASASAIPPLLLIKTNLTIKLYHIFMRLSSIFCFFVYGFCLCLYLTPHVYLSTCARQCCLKHKSPCLAARALFKVQYRPPTFYRGRYSRHLRKYICRSQDLCLSVYWLSLTVLFSFLECISLCRQVWYYYPYALSFLIIICFYYLLKKRI